MATIRPLKTAGGENLYPVTAAAAVYDAQGNTLESKIPGWDGKAEKVRVISVTLPAAGWTGEAAPFSQTVGAAGLTADGNGEIGLSQAATAEQRAAARDALLSVTGQGAGTLTVTADGEKPSLDLPCTLILLG